MAKTKKSGTPVTMKQALIGAVETKAEEVAAQVNAQQPESRLDYLAKKFQVLCKRVSKCFVDRAEEVTLVVQSILTGEHCCFLGDPGCAKSAVIEQVVKRIDGGPNYFWIQLFGETPPTDVFGQVSLKALREQDISRRNTQGHLPEAHFAFLDEIFQARSSILVGCNSILQERKFMNGAQKVDVPLISMFGASNFYPEDPSLVALWDRFLARKYVKNVKGKKALEGLLNIPEPPATPKSCVTMQDIYEAQDLVEDVKVTPGMVNTLVELFTTLEYSDQIDRNIRVSDRRKRKAVRWVKAAAFMRGADSVGARDLQSLRHVLWSHPDDREVLNTLLEDFKAVDPEELKAIPQAVLVDLERWRSLTDETLKTQEAARLLSNLKTANATLGQYKATVGGDANLSKVYNDCVKQLRAYNQEVLSVLALNDAASLV